MTLCKCEYTGELDTADHRRFHREWERTTTGHHRPIATEATHVEVTDIYIALDQIIAHLHGGPKPDLTPGAQGWLTKAAQ